MNKLTCLKCNESKPESEFYVIKEKTDYYCKYCRVGQSLISQRIGGKRNKRNCSHCGIQKHYAKGMCRNCYTRNQRHGSPEVRFSMDDERVYANGVTYEQLREKMLKRRYKINLSQFEEMSKNGCHICGSSRSTTKQLHVDHDHNCCDSIISCGLCVRGILCDACNVAVDKYENNFLRDDYLHRKAIIKYVKKHNKIIKERKNENSKSGL